MSAVAVSVEHLTKHFRIPLDRSTTLKYRVTHLRSGSRYRELLALKDISFEVRAGEFLGITGPNGCGKSTLLKILSRIYSPDSGRVSISGRVSPFLELGVGFNPELSARENIFLGGAVLGITRKELADQVDSILEFSELTEFADHKLKNFSSGMAVRLAFTVAIQAEADVLLMDEVLAVGDARFQQKCFDVFADYKRQGRTVILVSHDLSALDLYCARVLLLQKGEIIADGPATEVTSQYRRIVGAMSDTSTQPTEPEASAEGSKRWGTREVEITGVRLLDGAGRTHTTFTTGSPMSVAVDYVVNSDVSDFVVALEFKRSDGTAVAFPDTRSANLRIDVAAAGSRGSLVYRMDQLSLLGASYLITAIVYDEHLAHEYDHIEDGFGFRVVDVHGRHAMIDLQGDWQRTPVTSRSGAAPAPETADAAIQPGEALRP